MTDFFAELERELRAAAERPPRRLAGWPAATGRGLGVALAVIAFAAALVPALVIFGSGDEPATKWRRPASYQRSGPSSRKGEGLVPHDADSTVVATGRTRIGGRWQIESYRGTGIKDPETGEEYEPAGLRCLRLVTTDPVARGRAVRRISEDARVQPDTDDRPNPPGGRAPRSQHHGDPRLRPRAGRRDRRGPDRSRPGNQAIRNRGRPDGGTRGLLPVRRASGPQGCAGQLDRARVPPRSPASPWLRPRAPAPAPRSPSPRAGGPAPRSPAPAAAPRPSCARARAGPAP